MDPLRKVDIGTLLDYYGALLTDKQRRAAELYAYMDLSLGEIAADTGVTRQAAHDAIEKAYEAMASAEAALGLVRRAASLRHVAEGLRSGDIEAGDAAASIEDIAAP